MKPVYWLGALALGAAGMEKKLIFKIPEVGHNQTAQEPV